MFSVLQRLLICSLALDVFWPTPSFFLHATATPKIYTLSLHDALPISCDPRRHRHLLPGLRRARCCRRGSHHLPGGEVRKSTRLNSSHANISYAVFCLKKKIRPIFILSHSESTQFTESGCCESKYSSML